MKIYVCVIVYVLVFSACMNLVGPQVRFSSYEVNFGKVKEGSICTSAVTLYNTGGGILRIASAAADCGCTKVVVDKRSIEKGDSTEIHISVDTKNKLGLMENFVVIQANTDSTIHYIRVLSDVVE